MKRCGHCETEKPVHEFFRSGQTKSGLSSWCKSCIAGRHRDTYATKIKHKARRRLLMKLYGLTPEEYDGMLNAQGRRCGICRKPEGPRQFAVDHNHITGQNRMLLCPGCNWKIGFLETVDLTPYRAYLNRFNGVTNVC